MNSHIYTARVFSNGCLGTTKELIPANKVLLHEYFIISETEFSSLIQI